MQDDLHSRLDALAAKLDATRSTLKDRNAWHDGHHLTEAELKARYAYLQKELQAGRADPAVQAPRVTQLEQSVRQWIVELDL